MWWGLGEDDFNLNLPKRERERHTHTHTNDDSLKGDEMNECILWMDCNDWSENTLKVQFTLNVKLVLIENLGGILGCTQC